MALRRFNVKLFGAPWCEKCKQQKQMLYRMIGPTHWRDHYSDCGAAKCCLGCSGVKQVPLWKVNGCRYPGRAAEPVGGLGGEYEILSLQSILCVNIITQVVHINQTIYKPNNRQREAERDQQDPSPAVDY